jgi:arginine utilization protein RocB
LRLGGINGLYLEKRYACFDVVSLLRQKVTKVAEKIEESYEKHAYRFSKYNPFIPPNLKVNVLTYEELITYAIEQHGRGKILYLLYFL